MKWHVGFGKAKVSPWLNPSLCRNCRFKLFNVPCLCLCECHLGVGQVFRSYVFGVVFQFVFGVACGFRFCKSGIKDTRGMLWSYL